MTDWTLAAAATTSAPTVGVQSASVHANVVSPGNLLVVSVGNHRSTVDSTYQITDSNGGAWSAVGSVEVVGHLTAAAFWKTASSVDAANGVVVTLTPSGGSGAYTNSYAQLNAFQLPSNGYSFLGIDLATSTSSTSSATTESWSPSAGSLYPNNTDELVWTAFYSTGGNGGFSGGYNGFVGAASVATLLIFAANFTTLANLFGTSAQASSVAATNVFTNTWNTPVTNSAFFGATFVYSPPPAGGSVSAMSYGASVVTSPTFTPGVATASVAVNQAIAGVGLHNKAIGVASASVNAHKAGKKTNASVTAVSASVTALGYLVTPQTSNSTSLLGASLLGAAILGGTAGGGAAGSVAATVTASVATVNEVAYQMVSGVTITAIGATITSGLRYRNSYIYRVNLPYRGTHSNNNGLAYRNTNAYRVSIPYDGSSNGTIVAAQQPVAGVTVKAGVASVACGSNQSAVSVKIAPSIATETVAGLNAFGTTITTGVGQVAINASVPIPTVAPVANVATTASVSAYQPSTTLGPIPQPASGAWAATSPSVSVNPTAPGTAANTAAGLSSVAQIISVAGVASVATAAYVPGITTIVGGAGGVASVSASAYQLAASISGIPITAAVAVAAFTGITNGGVAPVASVAPVAIAAYGPVVTVAPTASAASVTTAASPIAATVTTTNTAASVVTAAISITTAMAGTASGTWAVYLPSISTGKDAHVGSGFAQAVVATGNNASNSITSIAGVAAASASGFGAAASSIVATPGFAAVSQTAYQPSTATSTATSASTNTIAATANIAITSASEMATVEPGMVGVAQNAVAAASVTAVGLTTVTPQTATVTLSAFAPASINLTAIPNVAMGTWTGNDSVVTAGPIVTPLPAGVICTAFSSPQVVMPAVGVAAVICDAYNIAQYYNPGAEFTAGLVKTGWVALDVDVGWTASSDFTIWHARLLQETGAV